MLDLWRKMESYLSDDYEIESIHEWEGERDAIGVYQFVKSRNDDYADHPIICVMRIDDQIYAAAMPLIFEGFMSHLMMVVSRIGDMQKTFGAKQIAVDAQWLKKLCEENKK